jgi:glycosyltransferase involved in cell wall biosynthesis
VRFQDRHIAERLGAFGPVLYVDPPISPRGVARVDEDVPRTPEVRIEASGVARLTSVISRGPERPGIASLTAARTRRAVRTATGQLGGSVGTLVSTSTEVFLAGCGERRQVHWAQDSFAGNAELVGKTARRVRRGEQRLARTVGSVIAANPVVATEWRDRGLDVALVPFGCDDELFARTGHVAPAEDVALNGPVAGFVGHIGERIDFALLERVADRGVSLLLVGPRHHRLPAGHLERIVARPNVQWVGERPFEVLPSYLERIDVGLVPYTDTPFNRASFPLKCLEYLAAGRAVVSTDLPAIRWLDTPLVDIADREPDAFAEAVFHAAKAPAEARMVAKRQAFARANGWNVRAESFADALGMERSRRPIVTSVAS